MSWASSLLAAASLLRVAVEEAVVVAILMVNVQEKSRVFGFGSHVNLTIFGQNCHKHCSKPIKIGNFEFI